MGKIKKIAYTILGSVSEVLMALGAGLLASVGPLSQANLAAIATLR